MKDRDIESVLQDFLDLETLRRTNILEVDAAEGRRDQLTGSNHVLGVDAVDLDIEDVDIRKTLEEDALSLHHGLARQRTDIAQSENRSPVAHHRNQVALRRVAVGCVRIPLDLQAGGGYAWRIGKG